MTRTLFGWTYGLTLAALLVVVPFVYYRWQYDHSKRLRVVTPGRVYRSGQMTAEGVADAVRRLGIRTVVNLQNEAPDPLLDSGRRESELVRGEGVRFVFIDVDLLDPLDVPASRPSAVDAFLRVMDDPDNYPVLVHCRAGLHRTGVLIGVYRMEYERWSRDEAIRELKAHGFGNSQATSRNDYITQYLLIYQSRAANSSTVHPGSHMQARP
jgi:protein tyrosine phosphatase (PTP) superfamily phosphohydrolase (DUF442 family)